MRESKIEAHLRREVERNKGRCLKFVSPGRVGVLDRIVQWPQRPRCYGTGPGVTHFMQDAETHYVETKRPGGKLSPQQRREHKWLKANGFKVFVLDTIAKVDDYIRRHA